MRPQVVLIGTGGTIASRFDPQLGRTVASQRGEDLLAQVPQLAEIADTRGRRFRHRARASTCRSSSRSSSRSGSIGSSRATTWRASW